MHDHQSQAGEPVEHARHDQFGRGQRGVDLAAEQPLERGELGHQVVRRCRRRRVQHDGHVEFGRGRPQCVEGRIGQSPYRLGGRNHGAVHAESLDRSPQLGRGGLGVGQVQRRVGGQAARGVGHGLGHRVVEQPHPGSAVTGGQILAVHVQPRGHDLVGEFLLAEPLAAVGGVEHDARHRPQRLLTGEREHVLVVTDLGVDAERPAAHDLVQERSRDTVAVYVDRAAGHRGSSCSCSAITRSMTTMASRAVG